ncbi:MAG: hypothetical protein JKY67_14555 [Pseudomonadales bacterium]|nr:hypothetical protein [Pseudomonadales bacterium]
MPSNKTQKVIIVGSQHLQNTLLAKYIDMSSPFQCEITDDVADFFTNIAVDTLDTSLERTLGDLLFLIDAQNANLEQCLRTIEDHRNGDARYHAVVFNLEEQANLEQIASWPILNGVFLHKAHEEEVIRGITAIFEGEIWLPRKLIAKYVRQARSVGKSSSTRCEELTNREVEVLKIMGTGAKNTDIASTLNLSPHTVKTHVYNIFKKINASNRLQAVNWAKDHL